MQNNNHQSRFPLKMPIMLGVVVWLASAAALLPALAKAPFQQALPGYQYQFPRDHASHPAYKTEWWYYTGHLKAPGDKTFGYELTFFRVGTGLEPLKSIQAGRAVASPWSMEQLYLAHFALTDDNGKRFYHTEQLTRGGLDWAGAATSHYRVWNKSWLSGQTRLTPGMEVFRLRADDVTSAIALDLALKPLKPPVVHGRDGVSQKADCVGCASHYYSMTRLETSGTLSFQGKRLPVTGSTWMDHEFGSNQMTPDQVGWDWFSVQLDDRTELMLYQLRRKDGTPDPNSSGTFIGKAANRNGTSTSRPSGPAQSGRVKTSLAQAEGQHLRLSQFAIRPLGFWLSPQTKGKYPSGWQIEVPSKQLSLTVQPTLKNQELSTRMSNGVSYWEGRCLVTGTQNGKPVKGQAYVELTGYAKAFHQKI